MLSVTGLSMVVSTGFVHAQTDRPPLKIILPVGPGSGVDTLIRSAQPSLVKALGGQAVIIENLPGAGGLTGTLAIVKAAPNGQTLGVVSNNHAVNPNVYKKMPYDSLADITPISVVGSTPFVLVVSPARVTARTARELADFLQARPGAYNYASSGNGTIIHLAGEIAVDALGADVRHIPYKGVGPMVTDLISGQVELGVVSVPAVLPHLKSGMLRAIGIMANQRLALLPDIPTMAEQGYPQALAGGWFAFVAPAKLPAAELTRLHEAVVTAFDMPEAREAMARQSNQIAPTTPQAAAEFFRSEQERYGKLVRKAGIAID